MQPYRPVTKPSMPVSTPTLFHLSPESSMIRRVFATFALILSLAITAQAQYASGWKAHDWERPLPRVVNPGEGCLPVPAPSDAIVLFDGSNLDAWRAGDGSPSQWIVRDGVMESVAGAGYIFTKQEFGDCQLHIEWSSPSKVQGKSQGRGNSGVYLMGRFEVQVLDSFENRTYADGSAGSIYGQFPPLVNASRRPGEWQSYDIIFKRPRFGEDGQLVAPAQITVLHNGIVIQNATEPYGPSSWLVRDEYKPMEPKLPLSLQDHGNPVRFRNIWIRELDENPYPPPTTPYPSDVVELTDEQLDDLVGNYGGMRIQRRESGLYLLMGGRELEMLPLSPDEFVLRYTSGKVTFERNEEGVPTKISFAFGGDVHRGERRAPKEAKE